MIRMVEAVQRASNNGCYLKRVGGTTEYRVGRFDWTRKEREEREYFTDDLEDAMLTSAQMKPRS